MILPEKRASRFGTLYTAKIVERFDLTKQGSSKRACHLTLRVEGPLDTSIESEGEYEPFTFKVGDSVGVFPKNPKHRVLEVIKLLKAEESLEETLTLTYSITTVSKKWVRFALPYAKDKVGARRLQSLLDQPWDRTHIFPLWEMLTLCENVPAQACLENLSPLLPRYYSIASSPLKSATDIDLLIGTFKAKTYLEADSPGLCTQYLAETADHVALFHHPSKNFTLPEDASRDIIMVGPGTGLAPYKGFLEEREAEVKAGKSVGGSWLFFGERNSLTDFYYQEKLQSWEKSGLVKLSTAFSRDQKEKVYIQDRLLENAAEIWDWLQRGSYFYVCGDAKHMARDVNAALQLITIREGGLSEADAAKYVRRLMLEGRYLQDVY